MGQGWTERPGDRRERSGGFEGHGFKDSQLAGACSNLSLLLGERCGWDPQASTPPRLAPPSRPGCQLLTQTSPQSPKLRVLQRSPPPYHHLQSPHPGKSPPPSKLGPWGASHSMPQLPWTHTLALPGLGGTSSRSSSSPSSTPCTTLPLWLPQLHCPGVVRPGTQVLESQPHRREH